MEHVISVLDDLARGLALPPQAMGRPRRPVSAGPPDFVNGQGTALTRLSELIAPGTPFANGDRGNAFDAITNHAIANQLSPPPTDAPPIGDRPVKGPKVKPYKGAGADNYELPEEDDNTDSGNTTF